MTRDEFLAELKELGVTQAQFASFIGRTPETVARWGILWKVPQYVSCFLETFKEVRYTRILKFYLDKHKQCSNGHDLHEYIGIKNGDLICSYCNAVVEPNIYNRGESE